jgi:hypothetical protein
MTTAYSGASTYATPTTAYSGARAAASYGSAPTYGAPVTSGFTGGGFASAAPMNSGVIGGTRTLPGSVL